MENWEVKKLGDSDLCEMIMGQSPSSNTYNDKEGTPFLQGKTEFEYIYPKPVKYTTGPIKIAEKNDILISVRAPVGDVNIAPYKLCIGRGLSAIRFVKNDFKFYFYWFQFKKDFIENLGMGSTFKAINADQLRKLEVPYPPIQEQKAIAEILSTVDDAIQKSDEAIMRTERLKREMMDRLLTKGIGHKNFKETKIGRIPDKWKVDKVEDIFEIITGTTPSTREAKYWNNGDKLWITPTDLSKLKNEKYVFDSERKITSYALKNVRLKELPLEAIILSTRAPVGYVAIIKKEASFNQGCKALIAKDQSIFPELYYYYFVKNRKYLESISGGSTFKELSKDSLRNLEIPIPSINEQKEIAEILQNFDLKLKSEFQRKQKFINIKKSLMNDLLTGKKRVKIN
ncbi:MAG: restriction endonuclease subunit S [Ignavibacteria bacterium]